MDCYGDLLKIPRGRPSIMMCRLKFPLIDVWDVSPPAYF